MTTMIRTPVMARRRSFRAALAAYLEALAASHCQDRKAEPQRAQAMAPLYWSTKAWS